MHVYVHFHIHTGKKAVTLHNVESVCDNGVDSVYLRMQFTDKNPTFNDVSHVAVKPE